MADELGVPSKPASDLAMPDAYRRWRASELGQITDTLEQELILGLI
jgi:hypothetical protein